MFSRFRRNSSRHSAVQFTNEDEASKTDSPDKGNGSESFTGDDKRTKQQKSSTTSAETDKTAEQIAEDERRQLDEEAKKLHRRPSLARRLSNTLLRRKSSTGSLGRGLFTSNDNGEDDENGTREEAATVLISFGRNDYGQLMRDPKAVIPADVGLSANENDTEITRLSTRDFESGVSLYSFGLFHSVVTTNRGTLYGGGDNEDGQLDAAQPPDFFNGAKPLRGSDALNAKKACSVAVGLKHSGIVTKDGLVLTWGSNESGQLGHSKDVTSRATPRQLDGNVRREKAVQIACSEGATFILTEKGQVWSTGEGARGELGRPEALETGCSWLASPVLGRLFCTPITSISAGAAHVVAVTVSGKVLGWGWNRHNQLGLKKKSDSQRFEPSPVALPLPSACDGVKSASCGTSHTALLALDGSVYTAGSNEYGQLGRLLDENVGFGRVDSLRERVGGDVVKIACGAYHTIVLTRSGIVLGFGSNAFGEIRADVAPITDETKDASSESIYEPVKCHHSSIRYAIDIGAGGRNTVVLMMSVVEGLTEEQLDERHQQMLQHRLGLSKPKFTQLQASTLVRIANESIQTNSLANLKGALLEFHATGLNRSFISSQTHSKVDVDGAQTALEETWKAMSRKKDGEKAIIQRYNQLHHELLDLSSVATEPDQLRAFFIALLNPACEWMPSTNYATLVKAVASLKDESLNTIAKWSVTDLSPESFASRLLKQLLRVVDFAAEKRDWSSRGCAPAAVRMLSRLHQFSMSRPGYASFDKFYTSQPNLWTDQIIHEEWRKFVRRDRHLPAVSAAEKDFSLFDHPFVLSAETKRNVLMYDQQTSQLQNAVMTALSQTGNPFFEITVRRDHLLDDSLAELGKAKRNDLTKPLRVAFEGEPGLDGGGVRKEFFELLSGELFNPNAPDFDLFYRPDPENEPTLLWLNARGKVAALVAKAEKLQSLRRERLQHHSTALRRAIELFQVDSFICPGKCPQGLQPYVCSMDECMCDLCEAPLGQGDEVYGCRTCNFDVCKRCREEDSPDATAAWRRVMFVGSLMGLAVYNATVLDVHFPLAFYAGLLDQPIKSPTLHDLSLIDSGLARGLRTMLEFPNEPPELFEETFGEQRFYLEDLHRELEPGGAEVTVTLNNRDRYVKRRCEFEVNEGVASLLAALMAGFKSVVDVHGDAMSLFSPPELELMIVGIPDINFAAMQKVARYEGGYDTSTPVVQWFWEICNTELNDNQKHLLLSFMTGASRSPIGRLSDHSLLIQRAGPDSDQLPTAHTCFNTLILPEYSSKSKLRDKLAIALMNAQGFGLQ